MTTTKKFTWGHVRQIHVVGEYEIVEYDPNRSSNVKEEDFDPSPLYHPFINEKDTFRSFRSLDAALVGAIAYKRDGCNTKADRYFMKMTDGAIDV